MRKLDKHTARATARVVKGGAWFKRHSNIPSLPLAPGISARSQGPIPSSSLRRRRPHLSRAARAHASRRRPRARTAMRAARRRRAGTLGRRAAQRAAGQQLAAPPAAPPALSEQCARR